VGRGMPPLKSGKHGRNPKIRKHAFPDANPIPDPVHTFSDCWCGSGHSWEKAKYGTVDGRTERQVQLEIKRRRSQ
jgi:hypothetical protein